MAVNNMFNDLSDFVIIESLTTKRIYLNDSWLSRVVQGKDIPEKLYLSKTQEKILLPLVQKFQEISKQHIKFANRIARLIDVICILDKEYIEKDNATYLTSQVTAFLKGNEETQQKIINETEEYTSTAQNSLKNLVPVEAIVSEFEDEKK